MLIDGAESDVPDIDQHFLRLRDLQSTRGMRNRACNKGKVKDID